MSRLHQPFWIAYFVMLLVGYQMSHTALAWDQDELARRASWQAPSYHQIHDQVTTWLATQSLTDEQRQQIDAIWQPAATDLPAHNLQRIVATLELLDPRAAAIVKQCNTPWQPTIAPVTPVWDDTQWPGWARTNMQLYYAIWLANEQLYDELHQLLATVRLDEVADPAALLFYQSVAFHRTLDRDQCLSTLSRLLENEGQLPTRYAAVAKLMKADLEPLKPDSLDEVSRLMDNIQVKLSQARAGKRVRDEEESVIKKLDKMIKELEDQAQAASGQSDASGGQPNQQSQPMQDSQRAELKGPGNVNPKPLGTNTDWGNLPPKEREEALQQLGKDLPSHYREVIEEYFRKLAREQEDKKSP